jgi:hypothetical protein
VAAAPHHCSSQWFRLLYRPPGAKDSTSIDKAAQISIIDLDSILLNSTQSMEGNSSVPVGRHHDVLQQLGDAEPTTALEAESVLESIRIAKGYLDDEIKGDIGAMPARSRETVLRMLQEKRDMEAQYTKKWVQPLPHLTVGSSM